VYARHITWYPSKLFDVHAKRYVVMATRMVFCDEHVTLRYVTLRRYFCEYVVYANCLSTRNERTLRTIAVGRIVSDGNSRRVNDA
jgi:hypothetical protein